MKNWGMAILLLLCMNQLIFAQEIRVHDPVVAKEGDTYYLFNTGRGIGVYTSKNLTDWQSAPQVFDNKPEWADSVVADFKNHIWAPDIFKKGDTWYLYYSVSDFGKNTSAIGVATNKTLDASAENYNWTDHGIVIRSIPVKDNWNAIDPNVIIDKSGDAWMTFGSFWSGLKLVKLKPDFLSVQEPREWYDIASRKNSALEAPFIYHKDGWYYLFMSWDLCCRGENSTYKIMVGRSQKITGPYKDKNGQDLKNGGGSLVLKGNENWHGTGHNSVYDFEGKDYLFFHAYDAKDDGKPKLRIKEISWKDGWPEVEPMK